LIIDGDRARSVAETIFALTLALSTSDATSPAARAGSGDDGTLWPSRPAPTCRFARGQRRRRTV